MKFYKQLLFTIIIAFVSGFLSLYAQSITIPTKLEREKEQKIMTNKLENLLKSQLRSKYFNSSLTLKYLINSKPINTKVDGGVKKLKLPGFKSYIQTSTSPKNEIRYQERLDRFVNIVAVVAEPLATTKEKKIKQQIVDLFELDLESKDTIHFIKLKTKKAVDKMDKKNVRIAKKQPVKKRKIDPKIEAESSKHLIRAREAFFQNNLDLALSEVIASLSLVPDMGQGYEMLGSIYYRLNWNQLAYKNWKKALEINPSNKKLEQFLTKVKN